MTWAYGIPPWELGRLTVAEFDQYQRWALKHLAKAEGAGGG